MNPGIEYYRPFGQQAFGYIVVNSKPTATPNIVIGGTTLTYKTHFFGDTPQQICQSLVAVINSDLSRQDLGFTTTFVRSVYAVQVPGNIVIVVATEPGLGGNNLVLTTTDSNAFTLSGATLASGTGGVFDNNYTNITTNATTVVKSGTGVLHYLSVNTRGAATTATIYDNTSATVPKIGTLDTTLNVATLLYDVRFNTGLTIVTAGTTPADLTVAWR